VQGTRIVFRSVAGYGALAETPPIPRSDGVRATLRRVSRITSTRIFVVNSETPVCHPWVALLALATIVFFSVRNILWIRRIPLPEGTDATGFLGARARIWYRECLRPLEEALAAASVGANALTYAQLVVAAFTGIAFANGAMFIAGWLVIASGTLDVLDGGVARRAGGGTPRGAFIDSCVDRYAELLIYAGLAVYFWDSWILWIVALALFGSMMVSYTRARAEGLGIDCKVGGTQRPERVVALGFGAFLSAVFAHISCAWTGAFSHALLATTLILIAVLSNVTALGRARWVARQLQEAS
jgi:phosphatidylglycerophosphate synthase